MIIVTRHQDMVKAFRALGLAFEGVPVLEHVTPSDIAGQDVLGTLPFHLAALAKSVTTLSFEDPLEGLDPNQATVKEYLRYAKVRKICVEEIATPSPMQGTHRGNLYTGTQALYGASIESLPPVKKAVDCMKGWVLGQIPVAWAIYAQAVTLAVLDIPQEYRGEDLSLEEAKRFFQGFKTYRVREC